MASRRAPGRPGRGAPAALAAGALLCCLSLHRPGAAPGRGGGLAQVTPSVKPPPCPEAAKVALRTMFGHSEFRPGQEEVISAAMHGRDTCVFRSTGSGKSLCYQIPALAEGLSSDQVVVVISPLISLMQDQCMKLNQIVGNSEHRVATFLGSAQTQAREQERALNGEYRLVYVSPEKLMANPSFLRGLKNLADRGSLKLVAVDEAHCVSQWGHDFRPEYQDLAVLREVLRTVPIMALTATASEEVRKDLEDSLMLDNPYVDVGTFDRPNLALTVLQKASISGGSAKKHLGFLLRQMQGEASSTGIKPTVIYCRTQRESEAVAALFQNELGIDTADVYHADLDRAHRQQVHRDFLAGELPVVSATVAFGMGIDKPDIRRVVHYGPPPSMEEYYQQIGRAGRDGKPAECILVCSHNDFSRYKNDYYMGGKSAEARKAAEDSLEALRSFTSSSAKSCRRATLLKFFGDEPTPNLDVCCDVCTIFKKYDIEDLERDFGPEVRLLLKAAGSADEDFLFSSRAIVEFALGRRKRGITLKQERIMDECARLSDVLRESEHAKGTLTAQGKHGLAVVLEAIFPQVVEAGYLLRHNNIPGRIGRRQATHDVFELSGLGRKELASSGEVKMRIPAVVLEEEQAVRNKATRTGSPKKASTLDLDEAKERESAVAPADSDLSEDSETDGEAANDSVGPESDGVGAGPTASGVGPTGDGAGAGQAGGVAGQGLDLWAQYHELLDLKRGRAMATSIRDAERMEELTASLQTWRERRAKELGVAPGSVMSDSALVTVSILDGNPDEALLESLSVSDALEAWKVLEELQDELSEKEEHKDNEHGESSRGSSDEAAEGSSEDPADDESEAVREEVPEEREDPDDTLTGLDTPIDELPPTIDLPIEWTAPEPWESRPFIKGELEVQRWHRRYQRFCDGEHVADIAEDGGNAGAPVKPATVVMSILRCLTYGLPVHLRRLSHEAGPSGRAPTKEQWTAIQDAFESTGTDPQIDDKQIQRKAVLAKILGDEVFMDKTEKTSAQKRKEQIFHNLLNWCLALARAKWTPRFEQGS